MGRIGIISVSHEDYLGDLVYSSFENAITCIKQAGHEPVSCKDQVTDFKSAEKAGKYISASDVDAVVIFLASWVECPFVMSVLMEVEHLPICLWGFGMVDVDGIKQSTGSYVSFAMFKGTLDRIGKTFFPLLASPDSQEALDSIAVFANAAECFSKLKHSRIGLVGYTSMGIYTGTFDHVLMRYKIGPEIVQFDSYSLINAAEKTTEKQSDEIIGKYKNNARICSSVTRDSLTKSAGIYAAMEKIVADYGLDAINMKCQYEFSKEYKMVPCVPLALLAETGIVSSCEGDMLCTVSMLILHYLSGKTVTYGDVMNHTGNTFKFSSCGFLPFSMGVQGEQLIDNFMPHPGFTGILNRFVMRPGRVTLLRLIEDVGDYHLLYFTGEGLKTELRQEYMPALDVKLDGDGNRLLENYSGQHYAICYGDISQQIECLASLLKIKTIRI